MTTTNDPEIYRERWNDHLNSTEINLKQSLPVDSWGELEDAIETLKGLVEYAAKEFE
jgi:hypothetical protein